MPKRSTVLIIRHCEKPDTGDELSAIGYARAGAYVSYFQNFAPGGAALKWTHLIAAANSANSRRPYLTLEPLARATGLEIDASYGDKDMERLAKDLRENPKYEGGNLLICWRHGEILQLAEALGVEAHRLPGSANWPSEPWPGCVFGWVLQLRFETDGGLIESQTVCLNQRLMYADHGQDPPSVRCD